MSINVEGYAPSRQIAVGWSRHGEVNPPQAGKLQPTRKNVGCDLSHAGKNAGKLQPTRKCVGANLVFAHCRRVGRYRMPPHTKVGWARHGEASFSPRGNA